MTDKTNSPEEMLDLVDIDDNVIGLVKKGDANKNPDLIHRESTIIICDKDNKVLIQRRSLKKKVKPGLWTASASGHVLSGDTPENTAHKELEEELGFDTDLIFLHKELVKSPTETHFTFWFRGRYNNEPIKIDKNEVEEVRFVHENDLDKLYKDGFVSETSYRLIKKLHFLSSV